MLSAAVKLERTGRDVQEIEFTIDCGRLNFLQSRAAKLAPGAAVRIAVDLVREGVIDESEALRRVTPEQVRLLLSPHLAEETIWTAKLLASGEGASPGVGIGIVVDNSDEAERRARAGEASAEGVRAVAAGLEFIVADPVLPALLQAARMTLETILASKQKETL